MGDYINNGFDGLGGEIGNFINVTGTVFKVTKTVVDIVRALTENENQRKLLEEESKEAEKGDTVPLDSAMLQSSNGGGYGYQTQAFNSAKEDTLRTKRIAELAEKDLEIARLKQEEIRKEQIRQTLQRLRNGSSEKN